MTQQQLEAFSFVYMAISELRTADAKADINAKNLHQRETRIQELETRLLEEEENHCRETTNLVSQVSARIFFLGLFFSSKDLRGIENGSILC